MEEKGRTVGRADQWGTPGLWERPALRQGFLDGSITAVVKPGDRANPIDPTHNPPGVPLAVRFLKVLGNQAKNIPPELYPDEGLTVERIGMIVKPIRELTEEDLKGLPPIAATPELLGWYLALIGNTVLPSDEFVVTIWRFRYLPKWRGAGA